MSFIDPDQPYPMHLPRLGDAIIINNVTSEMPGSKADVTSLRTAYERVGFTVHVHNDCNAQEMRSVKKLIMADETHVDSNCLIVTIICHGNDKGQLLDRDKRKAWDTELFIGDLSDVTTLAGKPKIMIIQACRGNQVSEGHTTRYLAAEDERESTNILPDKADMFLAYATVPGFKALGADVGGSVYLQALAECLQNEFMRRPLNKILQMVRQRVIHELQGKQCPEERNSLIYDVMFSEYHTRHGTGTRSPVASGASGQPKRFGSTHNEPKGKPSFHGNTRVSTKQPEHSSGNNRSYPTKFPDNEPTKNETDSGSTWQTSQSEARGSNGGNHELSLDKTRLKMASMSVGGDSFGRLSLRLLFTHKTSFKELNSFTVLPSGDLVLCGSEGRGKWEYHVLSTTNQKLEHKVTVKVSCKHETHVLPVGDNSEIWASCEFCKKIKHVDLGKGDTSAATSTAYGDAGLWPGRLCEGATGYVMVYSLGNVLELSAAKKPKLTGPVKTIETSLSNCAGMCYLPAQRGVVLSDGSGGVVRAVSRDGRASDTLWEVKGVVDGRLCDPRGLAYLPRVQLHSPPAGSHPGAPCLTAPAGPPPALGVLLVCDGGNTRLLALDPQDGRHRQTVALPEHMGEVEDIWVVQDTVVLQHTAENSIKISVLSLT